ncbi:enterochelin esterase [Vibrio quintilis]|uniref:Enterochelin esterase n=1 Tax=Vibrio quintilis TaxID=1117707 RepID=A0A1M7YXD4_9VIBR|nr:enterochelin esterase [Vibrio quintilis]SHO57193.1 Enterochelin esterase [Vibrio quintilis]
MDKYISSAVVAITSATLIACSHSPQQPELLQTYQFDQQQEIILPLSAGQYIRGNIQSLVPLNEASILNPQNQIIKSLLKTGQREGEIFWKVETSGSYRLRLQTNTPEKASVQVHLYGLPLKANQSVNPQDVITSPLLLKAAAGIEKKRPEAEPDFWQKIRQQGTPLLEPQPDGNALLTFLWRGKADNVRILGAPYDGHAYMSHLANSEIWYKTYTIPDGTRFSYRLAPDVPQIEENQWREQRQAVLATVGPDPLNTSHFAGDDIRFGQASTITYGQAPDDKYTRQSNSPQGNTQQYQFFSQLLGNNRKITVYEPAAQQPLPADAPLLILFDGDDYLSKVPTPTILDNLIAAHQIPPMRAVFIHTPLPSLRSKELPPNPVFADFMATELMPWLHHSLGITPSGEDTVLTGSSFGGLASLYVATRHPETFGKVLSQSGSFWWGPDKAHPQWLTAQLRQQPKLPIQIYMNAGLFETKPEFANILQTNRALYQVLKTKGYPVMFEEVASGHDYFSWRVTIANGLIRLFSHQSDETSQQISDE